MGVHSLEKLGAKMGANSFYYQRVRAERNSENLGALNSLLRCDKQKHARIEKILNNQTVDFNPKSESNSFHELNE